MRGQGQCQRCCCYFCQRDSPSRVLTSSLACQGLPQECHELLMVPGMQQECSTQLCHGILAVGTPGVQVHHQVLWMGAPSPL